MLLGKLKRAYNLGKEKTHLELGSNFAADRGTCSNFPFCGSYRAAGTNKDRLEASLRLKDIELQSEKLSFLEKITYKLGRDSGFKDREELYESQRQRTKELELILEEGLGVDINNWFFRASPRFFTDPETEEYLEEGEFGGYIKDLWVGLTKDNLIEFYADYRVDKEEEASIEIINIFKKHRYHKITIDPLREKDTTKNGGPFYFSK